MATCRCWNWRYRKLTLLLLLLLLLKHWRYCNIAPNHRNVRHIRMRRIENYLDVFWLQLTRFYRPLFNVMPLIYSHSNAVALGCAASYYHTSNSTSLQYSKYHHYEVFMRRHGMKRISILLRFERGPVNFHLKGPAMRFVIALVFTWTRCWTNSAIANDLNHNSLMGRHHNVDSYSDSTKRDE